MKRFSAIAAMLVLTLTCAACQSGKDAGSKYTSKSLYSEAVDLSQKISILSKDDAYIGLLSHSDVLQEKISQVAKQEFKQPKAVYEITGVKESTLAIMNEDTKDGLSKEVEEIIRERFVTAVCSQINSLNGAEFMAAASMLSVRTAFHSEGLKEPVIYLCVYDDDYGTMIAYTPYEEEIVDATANIISMSGLSDTVSEEEVSNLIKKIPGMKDVTVKEVEK